MATYYFDARKERENIMNEFDVVELVKEFENLPIGTEGTIVHKYNDVDFEVEFFDKNGDSIDVYTIS
jgi:hypothetical protein